MSLAKMIKSRRIELGLSAKFVASQLGVASSTYFDWEQGRGIKGEEFYAPLSLILKLSLSELILGKTLDKEITRRLEEIEEHIKSIRSLL